ncbi:hypothetical protein BFW01_g12532 [Lasiodiplodia theobromae]|uniref:DUF788 domain protein n=1 Tax=Lasiodiplodia theobromae TaxID=45133 RepID=A0A5N5DL75_9PEZI|nr:uncharacterized protein LTHEOB_7339 [Lasiodiplodia theobromae]KAB2578497.1 hypothetical protein DBV05_g2739 [Lasiodiplodia theobromae]KAF4542609.1 hypothetical protein LTHEOB_7339 [Lasiodiplodia theobromae]KAF9640726.1 hypothetical protein BFW01_g12532 [Lasiodiplodia theobromae]
MAQKSQKQLAARNKEQLNRAHLITLGIHFFFLLSKFLFAKTWSGRSITVYILCSLPSLVIQFWFERIARPTYDKETGQLRRAGEDLEAQGLTEWMWDVLYWTQGVLVIAAALGDGAWWLWLAVPVYSAYLAYTTFIGARQSMAGLSGAGNAEGISTGSKRQQKLEKRGGQRVQYR